MVHTVLVLRLNTKISLTNTKKSPQLQLRAQRVLPLKENNINKYIYILT